MYKIAFFNRFFAVGPWSVVQLCLFPPLYVIMIAIIIHSTCPSPSLLVLHFYNNSINAIKCLVRLACKASGVVGLVSRHDYIGSC